MIQIKGDKMSQLVIKKSNNDYLEFIIGFVSWSAIIIAVIYYVLTSA
jgi:hypothetical protein